MQLSVPHKAAVGLTAAALLAGGLGVAVASNHNSSPNRTTTGISGPSRSSAGEDIVITGSLRDARGRAVASAVLRVVGREAGSNREQNLYYGKTNSNGNVAFRFTPPPGRSQYKVVYNGSSSPRRDPSQSATLTVTVTRGPASPSPSATATASGSPTESASPDPSGSAEPSASASPTSGGPTCLLPVPVTLPVICSQPSSSPTPSGSETPTPTGSATPEETATPTPTATASAH